VIRSVANKPLTLTIRPDMLKNPAPGLMGGLPGARGQVFFNGRRLEWFPPLELNPGDEVVLRAPGGGGFGPPEEREPDRVRQDIELRYVTPEAARAIYKTDV
jgi:N-methylhydantoinase B